MPFCDTEAQELPRGQVCHHAKGASGQASLMQAVSCLPGRTLTAASNIYPDVLTVSVLSK